MKTIIGIFGLITLAVMSAITVVITKDFIQDVVKIISGDDKTQKGK